MNQFNLDSFKNIISKLENTAIFVVEYRKDVDDYIIIIAEGEELKKSGLYKNRLVQRRIKDVFPDEYQSYRSNIDLAFEGKEKTIQVKKEQKIFTYQFIKIEHLKKGSKYACVIWKNITDHMLRIYQVKELKNIIENIAWAISHEILHETSKIKGLMQIKEEIEQNDLINKLNEVAQKINQISVDINNLLPDEE